MAPFNSSLPTLLSICLSLLVGFTQATSYAVPPSPPSGAAALDPAPVGISFEFFTFPSYFTNVSATNQCLQNFETLTGIWPPIRIGGATQDRAQYDATATAYVVYSVASPTDAPSALTFGPSFMSLAATYKGEVVLGLNREYNNIANTIAAAKVAKSKMSNLFALELGNEPKYWSDWTTTQDYASQNNWDVLVGQQLNEKNIIQAGVYDPASWKVSDLIATENSTVLSYVKDYSHHNYPGGTLKSLMSHVNVISNVKQYGSQVSAATGVGKQFVFGETNSVAGGGAATISPTFGAGLWTLDYILRGASIGAQRFNFHHGTIGKCYYCWWGRSSMGNPYYGAYAAAVALAGGSKIAEIDNLSTNYAVYVIYNSANKPIRVVLHNSDYFDGSGTRGSQAFTLTGLNATKVTARRLTAASALSRQDQSSPAKFGGQTFADGTCKITGTAITETYNVSGGAVTAAVKASEALLVYL